MSYIGYDTYKVQCMSYIFHIHIYMWEDLHGICRLYVWNIGICNNSVKRSHEWEGERGELQGLALKRRKGLHR